jgi:hypothetical protein
VHDHHTATLKRHVVQSVHDNMLVPLKIMLLLLLLQAAAGCGNHCSSCMRHHSLMCWLKPCKLECPPCTTLLACAHSQTYGLHAHPPFLSLSVSLTMQKTPADINCIALNTLNCIPHSLCNTCRCRVTLSASVSIQCISVASSSKHGNRSVGNHP